jgi:hypothetical protein
MFASKDLFFTRPSGYQISRSVRLRSSASAYFNRTFTTPTDGKKYTFSIWAKRGAFGAIRPLIGVYPSSGATDSTVQIFEFSAADILQFTGQTTTWRATTAVYRDPSAWYHIVLVYDSTQATAANRELLYVNGVQVTAFTTSNDVALNTVSPLNANGAVVHIGSEGVAGAAVSRFYDGYLTEINFIDGQALTPSSFGQTNTVTGVWQPIKYTGTYGTNGFYLNFSDNSNNTATTIGKDNSGNGNNWTPNNISVTAGVTYDSMLDVPTPYADGGNGRGNYCVLNPLDKNSNLSPSDANLTWAVGTASQYSTRSTIFPTAGKWYAEFTINNAAAIVGIANQNAVVSGVNGLNGVFALTTQIFNNSGSASQTGLASFAPSDVLAVAYDADLNTVQFYRNNSAFGTSVSISATGPLCFYVGSNGSAMAINANFGQRPFTYTPPSGFVALNTQNLPTPTISNGANYMAATTYSGTAATNNLSNAVNGISFQPDLVWIKIRNAIGYHALADSLRTGTGGLALLSSNATDAEYTTNLSSYVTGFNSNGVALGNNSNTAYYVNRSGDTYVAWQWNAGGSTVTNTSGSISAQVRANTTAGFSVVTYTGTGANATVGHGLGVAPKMVIVKERSAIRGWPVYHASLTSATYYLDLQTTAAQTSAAVIWNSTAPTSTVFSIGTDVATNQSANTYVAYCFSEVAGYSKFGSYTGNGSTDGPFVYCGFRPRFVMWKDTTSTSAGSDWFMFDTSRNTYNTLNNELAANLSSAENIADGGQLIDILSNGFKPRMNSYGNASGATNIYVAFAENPFKYSLAR